MTDATELKKLVKQLQGAGTESVIDFFDSVFGSSTLTFMFFFAGNNRCSACNEKRISSERSFTESGHFTSFFPPLI
jgi:hypothetical protein